jgi:DNA-binding NtrC family response regulator
MSARMARLLRDRYLLSDRDHAWDLATGAMVPLATIPAEAPRAQPPLDALVEVLDHGVEGAPRWLVAQVPSHVTAASLAHRVAIDAACRGFVPIAVDLYDQVRERLADDLQDRALVLIGGALTRPAVARAALLDAASRSPRPHLLLTLRGVAPSADGFAREARAVYAAVPSRLTRAPRLQADAIHHLHRVAHAVTLVATGRHAAADRLLCDAAGALQRRGLHVPAAQAWIAAGRLALERGRTDAAERLFDVAVTEAIAASDEGMAAAGRIWQAVTRTDAGRFTAAEAQCRAVLVTSPGGDQWSSFAEAALARVLLWQGRLDDALRLRIVEQDNGEEAGPFACATAIRVLLEAGRMFEAGQRARRLLDAAERGDDPLARIIAATAHLRLLIATGDLGLAERRFVEVVALARRGHLPLRAIRARLLWTRALQRGGRISEATASLRVLSRVAAAAPPLLRQEIASCRHDDRRDRPDRLPHTAAAPTAVRLITFCNTSERDADAVAGVVGQLLVSLNASRVELCSAHGGPVSVMTSAGSGVRTAIGPRVLEAGIAIGGGGEARYELGVPVRFGVGLLGALVSRWPVDRTPPPDAEEMMTMAAAIVAPRLEAVHAAGLEAVRAVTAVPELLGDSDAINEVRRLVARAAAAPFAVLVEGESGVGKELVARAVHQLSARRQRRFCDVNCAALPDDLLESELFGHARGAFTGAVAERPGLFEDADGGTLFLDEVADLSLRAQAKLLRVVQQHEVRRIGETFSRRIDVRLVTAANRDMRTEAEAGRFRHDLLYRLDVIRIAMPPLRERPEDIPLLAMHFWRIAAGRVGTTASLTHGLLAALAAYHWPGNVRELQNVIAALAVAAPARGAVRPGLLPGAVAGAMHSSGTRLAEARGQFERRFVAAALARAGGSRTRAARELGVSRQGLAKLLARLQLPGNAAPDDVTPSRAIDGSTGHK